jgi:hypothetical protein
MNDIFAQNPDFCVVHAKKILPASRWIALDRWRMQFANGKRSFSQNLPPGVCALLRSAHTPGLSKPPTCG